jgi:hypothetical protein
MDTLASWLRSLGLEQYVELFESHGIDLHSLPLLLEQDLVELGVLLEHRRLLLKAISALDNDNRATPPTSHAARDAERRQLTILFAISSDRHNIRSNSMRRHSETSRTLTSARAQISFPATPVMSPHTSVMASSSALVFRRRIRMTRSAQCALRSICSTIRIASIKRGRNDCVITR